MKRRELLRLLAATPLLATTTRLYAAPQTSARLLVVFMRGGYDAANLLVPVSSNFYYEARPNIAVPKPGTGATAALPLDANWGLHPALRESIFPLVKKGQAAFIPFAGTDDLTRSHFETQDSIELGQALNSTRNYNSGFLNRLVSVLTGSHAIAFTDQLPIALNGDIQVPNMALRSLGKPGVDPRQSANIAAMYQNTKLAPQVAEGFSVRNDVMKEMAGEMEAASRNAITTKGFELEARRIAKLMKEQFNVGFVDVGGWDTHVGEGGASGYLAGRLEELGRGLAGFADEIGGAWQDTVVVVISEFGRTFRENGNRGTDHGHGSVYWLLGGGLHTTGIAGEQIRVEQNTLFQNRDYPVLNEYRAIFGGLFARMYGLGNAQLERVFAGVAPKDLKLL
jgi:uncharacterized protein (DUF1501 family)